MDALSVTVALLCGGGGFILGGVAMGWLLSKTSKGMLEDARYDNRKLRAVNDVLRDRLETYRGRADDDLERQYER